jgi:serine/threonine protein kinase
VLNGSYTLVRFLGAGGMGAVYAAQTSDGRRVAVKVLLEMAGGSIGARERFAREANVAAALDCPHSPVA